MKESSNTNRITIYTDGSSLGNPGPGGWAAVMQYKDNYKEFHEGYYKTTNNRMELLAVISALERLKKHDLPVVIHSDSSYVVNAVNKNWIYGWEKKNFAKRKNSDLWRRFLAAYRKFKLIELVWVRGHAGNPLNERCDVLAKKAAEFPNKKDEGFFING